MLVRVGLLLVLMVCAAAAQSDEAHALINDARAASDIYGQRIGLLADVALTGEKRLTGAYRLLWDSQDRWREETIFGPDSLVRIRVGNKLYTKATSPRAEYLLEPFNEIGSYSLNLSVPDDKKLSLKERSAQKLRLRCVVFKSDDANSERCFRDGLYVGDEKGIQFSDFRPALGKQFPYRWSKTERGFDYAGEIKKIVQVENLEDKFFVVDGSFEESETCDDSKLKSGHLIKQPPPSYPLIAKASRVQGTVVMKVKIDTAGNVVSVVVLSGHPMLRDEAVDSVRHWKYAPTLCAGQPMTLTTRINVNFAMAR
jgi:TonB family protein